MQTTEEKFRTTLAPREPPRGCVRGLCCDGEFSSRSLSVPFRAQDFTLDQPNAVPLRLKESRVHMNPAVDYYPEGLPVHLSDNDITISTPPVPPGPFPTSFIDEQYV
jgi:hypothetical protein